MKVWENYFETMQQVVTKVRETQEENILKGANILAECTEKGGIIHTFGAGHSHLIAEDIFWRAATLANIHAILEPSITGNTEVTKSSYIEKLENIGKIIVNYHKVKSPDVMIAISNSGNNAVTIEVAQECQKRGIEVIAITAVEYSDYLKTLHVSGKKLKDCADVVIDTCSIIGDAVVEIDGYDMKVGSSSTIPAVFIQTSLLAQTVEELVKKGFKPDVYYNGNLSANSEEVKIHNDKLIDKYYYKIRNL